MKNIKFETTLTRLRFDIRIRVLVTDKNRSTVL